MDEDLLNSMQKSDLLETLNLYLKLNPMIRALIKSDRRKRIRLKSIQKKKKKLQIKVTQSNQEISLLQRTLRRFKIDLRNAQQVLKDEQKKEQNQTKLQKKLTKKEKHTDL